MPARADESATPTAAIPALWVPSVAPASGGAVGRTLDYEGRVVIAGAPFEDHQGFRDTGSALVAIIDGGVVRRTRMAAPDPSTSAQAGSAVATDGQTVVMGFPAAPLLERWSRPGSPTMASLRHLR